ncbi:MAG: nuclear transport factor 2 family protein [Ilumatobacteraceae bacterium]
MYKASVRALVRHGIGRLNEGDPEFLLRMATPASEIAFPGDNSWAAMFRPVEKGRRAVATHRGMEELRAFADRFVADGIQFQIEDILVNGPPWRTRVAVRAHVFVPSNPGADRYNNRVVAFMDVRWGKFVRWEDYEDTQRVAEWDRSQQAVLAS